jgi:DNA invertase Pin-like site-specific DNA recombinase
MMNVSASLAEFERSLIVERCQAGRREARLKGKKFGRLKGLPSARVDSCCALYKAGIPIEDIQRQLGINPVYSSQKKESE